MNVPVIRAIVYLLWMMIAVVTTTPSKSTATTVTISTVEFT